MFIYSKGEDVEETYRVQNRESLVRYNNFRASLIINRKQWDNTMILTFHVSAVVLIPEVATYNSACHREDNHDEKNDKYATEMANI